MEYVNQNAGEHRVKDPVCGMTVDPQNAAGVYEYKGQTYFFCSVGCREKFKSDPERFLNHEPATPIGIQRGPKQQPVATEIVSEPRAVATGSYNTAHIGLRPYPVATARASDTIPYTSPMHAEIGRDGPGSLRICALVRSVHVATGDAG